LCLDVLRGPDHPASLISRQHGPRVKEFMVTTFRTC